MLLLLTRSPLVLHGLEDRAADPIRKYAISQRSACVRVDRARTYCRDSVVLMFEDDYLVLGYSRLSCRVVLNLAGNDAKARILAFSK